MSVKSTAVTVTTTATRLDTPNPTDYKDGSSLAPFNNSAQTIYVGGADVTTANGIPVIAGSWGPSMILQGGERVYGIVAATTAEARVLETGV